MKTKRVGLVLYNGSIYTQDRKQPFASALALEGNRIIEVGKDSLAQKYPTSKFKKVNLKQRTVLPAFCDCHTHFLGYVRTLDKLNLERAESFKKALELIRRFVNDKREGEWVLGFNWDANLWEDSRQPDKKVLDQISTVHPMAFSARDGHQLWVNSLALKVAGINQSTVDFPSGEIVRYENSREPSGILKDNARQPVNDIISRDVKPSLVGRAIRNLHRKGITGIHNMENGESLGFFQKLEFSKKLSLRVWQTIAKDDLDEAIKLGLRSGFGSERLRIGGVKIFADGALGSRTALMFEPYENETGNFGLETVGALELTDLVKRASRAKISAVIHAIGDRANFNALQAIKKSDSSDKLRHRIEHAQIVRPEDLDLFGQLRIIASIQPVHCPNDYQMAAKHWGERNVNAYPLKSLLQKKVKVCFGSDFPLYDFDPIMGIYSAVNRKLPKSNHPAWNESQKIYVKDAISAYTKNAAYASGREKDLGMLSVGKLADLVTLSGDPYKSDPEEIERIKATATVFDGELVWGDLY